MMGGNDDVPGVLANMGLGRGPRWQLFATTASAASVVNSMVGGSCVAILLASRSTSAPPAAAANRLLPVSRRAGPGGNTRRGCPG
jgi:hypothetical protein